MIELIKDIILLLTVLITLTVLYKSKPKEITPEKEIYQMVDFHGLTIEVPNDYYFLSMDADGEVIAFTLKPQLGGMGFNPDARDEDHLTILMVPADAINIEWWNSLIELP